MASRAATDRAMPNERAKARRWTGSRLERDGELRDLVLDRLRRGWSPEQIAGWLACDPAAPRISHESIYRFIYAQIRRTNDGSWRLYLPRAKSKRGWRGRKGGSPASFIQGRVSIAERPKAANGRAFPGHWEADLMLFKTYGQAILVAHERVSRILILAKQPNKTAKATARKLSAWLKPLPPELRQTITFDNGTEFAKHYRLKADLGIQTFFCDTHSPWQKGGIENAIGRMRRPLPRKTDLLAIRPKTLNAFVAAYNNTPRKCLDFQTPAEAFLAQRIDVPCFADDGRADLSVKGRARLVALEALEIVGIEQLGVVLLRPAPSAAASTAGSPPGRGGSWRCTSCPCSSCCSRHRP